MFRFFARLPAALILILAILVAGCSSGTTGAVRGTTAATESATSEIGWLFVLDASSGAASTAADGSIELVLDKVDGGVTTFSDRPQRSAAHESPADFVGSWADRGFDEDPPNAALVLGDETVVVLTLSDPRWDEGSKRLAFAATELEPGTRTVAGRAGGGISTLPATFAGSSLFVDASAAVTPVTVMFDYSGSSQAIIDVDNVLAGPGPRSLTSTAVEGIASIDVRGSAEVDSTTITIMPSNGNAQVSVALTVMPNPDGTVTGTVLSEGGGQMSGRFVIPAGAPTTLTIDAAFTLRANA